MHRRSSHAASSVSEKDKSEHSTNIDYERFIADEQNENRPEQLAASLGITFANVDYLRLALTHRSVLHEWAAAAPSYPLPQSNERLEFLGDSYLGMIVADYLYNHFPEATEGELTSRRVQLVRAERLVSWAREINLADYLYLAQGERVTERARDRMLAGAFEALIAAIAIDGGMPKARRFLHRFLDREIDVLLEQEKSANPKGRLQEAVQERYRIAPIYRTIRAEGPSHARVFTAEVSLAGLSLGTGVGRSKREAEQAAARVALEQVDALPAELNVEERHEDELPETRRE